MLQYKIIFGLILTMLLASCQNDACTNSNPELNKLEPGTQEYNAVLAAEMRSREEKHYIFEGYEMQDSVPHLAIKIKADGLCGKIDLEVRRTDKHIQPLLDAKGLGYNGAELENLQMIPTEDGTHYLYDKIDGMED